MTTPMTAERAREIFDYIPETGKFINKQRRQGAIVGAEAGFLDMKGYVRIKTRGFAVRGHRLAWLMAYGVWPAGEVDHINGDRADNRLGNLREVSRKMNSENRRVAMPGNGTGLLGACSPSGADKKFKAVITSERKSRVIGRYGTAEEAHEAYVRVKRRLHEGCTI